MSSLTLPERESAARVRARPAGHHVYILARKVLLRNTRIFKQASSLTEAGYRVTVIGILPAGGEPIEHRDGYRILRVPLDPIYVRWPRKLRRAANSLNQRLLRLPGRYLRGVLRLRRRWRAFAGRCRRIGRRTAWAARRRTRRGWRRLRRTAARLPKPVRQVGRAVNVWWGSFRRGWQWLRRAAETGGADSPPSAHSRLMQALALPIVLPTRGIRWIALTAVSGVSRAREAHAAYRALFRIDRRLVRVLRAISEFAISRLSWLLRRFAWPLKSVEYYKQVYGLVTAELGPADIIHANDLDTLWVASRLAHRYSVPLIYDAQELYVGLHTLPRWYRAVLTLQEWFLLRRVDRVIAVNDAIADVMAKRYRVRIDQVVLNCPPLYELELVSEAPCIRERLGLPRDERVLLYSGALTPKRGLENTLLALGSLDRVSLVMLGEGPLRLRLEALAQQHGLDDRLHFLDFVHHIDVPAYISSADLGVIPYEHVGINHYLCSPSKLFHYVMAGLPIVCSDFPFLRSVVLENGVGAVFDPSKPQSIAAAIRRVLDNPAESAACRTRLQAIKQRYSWEAQATQFLAVYGSLYAEKGPPSLVNVARARRG